MRRAARRRADEIDVIVEAGPWLAALPEAAALAERAARAALARATPGGGGDCALLLADDATVQALNRRYRDQDKPTNVLSFPLVGGDDEPLPPPGQPRHLGDVVLAYETLQREAEAQGKPLAHHLAHLTVHGVLHLLGHDHGSDSEAAAMEALETEILAGLGLPDPYATALYLGEAAP